MAVELSGRNLISMRDLSGEEILAIVALAEKLKANRAATEAEAPLRNKTLAMIFQKPSLRTRVSFEAGMTRLGGHAIYLAPADIKLGQRETTEDIALVVSRYVDIIMARVFGHDSCVSRIGYARERRRVRERCSYRAGAYIRHCHRPSLRRQGSLEHPSLP